MARAVLTFAFDVEPADRAERLRRTFADLLAKTDGVTRVTESSVAVDQTLATEDIDDD